MTERKIPDPAQLGTDPLPRRRFLKGASAGVAGSVIAGRAAADTLADVPPREPGAPCAACHGDKGQGGLKDRLVGGQGTLASDNPIKTVGSFWPYATTLFDYIHRAMPYQAPGSLSVDDTYAVAAYILNLNDILPADGKLDKATLPMVKMPNRNGFIPDPEFSEVRAKE